VQICIDLFLLAQSYVDIATLATLTNTTGGSLYHYLPFNPMMDQDQLLNDLKWNVSRPQVTKWTCCCYLCHVSCQPSMFTEPFKGHHVCVTVCFTDGLSAPAGNL
jgi:hypothetical protein